MKIAIVTDSTSSLTADEVNKYHITVMPIPVIVDEKEYLDNIDLTANELYQMQENGSDFPKTSQPSVGQLIDTFQKLHDKGYDAIIMIPLASTISGFYQSIVTIANQYPEFNVYPVDSEITVRLMGYLVLAAAKMAATDKYTPEEIVAKVNGIKKSIDEIFVVDDLNNLVRGGRLSNATALVGSMLQIKPLLTFDDESHKIVSFDKVRSIKKAIAKAEKLMIKRIEDSHATDQRIIIYHANDIDHAEEIKKDLAEKFPDFPIEIDAFGSVIGTHLGQGAIGLTWMDDIEKMIF